MNSQTVPSISLRTIKLMRDNKVRETEETEFQKSLCSTLNIESNFPHKMVEESDASLIDKFTKNLYTYQGMLLSQEGQVDASSLRHKLKSIQIKEGKRIIVIKI